MLRTSGASRVRVIATDAKNSAVSSQAQAVRTDQHDTARHSRIGSVGPVVIGSMLFGVLAAVVLVVGPFGGAQEHVISGTALLGFAAGWALLAAGSTRWTAQPQRWAFVPAGVLALAGAGLLVFAPGDGALDTAGWVWPPAALALVVWMVARARRRLRSRTRASVLYPVFGIMTLAALGGAYQTIAAALDRGAYPMHGQLVDVGGRRLHVECSGTGQPTVVLEAGLGEIAATMSAWLAPAVARDTRVCVYDRAGHGWSDPSAGVRDGLAVATDLHTLLERAGVAGPYILVGHSTGGVYVRVFAAAFPEQVAGMVLVDSQPNDAFTRLPNYPGFYSVYRRVIALMPSLARLGVVRLSYLADAGAVPAQARSEERAIHSTAGDYRSSRDEFAAIPAALEQARALVSIGDKPLAIVTAGSGSQEGWLPLQEEMAALSTRSVHQVVPEATHASLVDDERDAAVSSRAILNVVAAVRSGTSR